MANKIFNTNLDINGDVKSNSYKFNLPSSLAGQANTLIPKTDGTRPIWYNNSSVANNIAFQSDIDDLQIGGKNLILNSDSNDTILLYGATATYENIVDNQLPSKQYFKFTNVVRTIGNYVFFIPTLSKPNKFSQSLIGKKIQISFYIRSNNSQKLVFNSDTNQNFMIDSTWQKVRFNTVFNDMNLHFFLEGSSLTSFDISSVKIEFGDKATDWTPAPEDKQDRLQNITGNIGVGKTDTSATEKLDVNGNVKASSFIKSGGTSTQFLMANGDVIEKSTISNQTLSTSIDNNGRYLSISGGNQISIDSRLIHVLDSPNRNPNDPIFYPNVTGQSVRFDFISAGHVAGTGYNAGLMTFSPWDGTTNSTGDSSYQLAFYNQTGDNGSGIPGLKIRKGIDTTWNNWYKIYTTGDFEISDFHKVINGSVGNQDLLLPNGNQVLSTGNTSTNFDGDLSNKIFEGTFANFNGYSNSNKTLGFTLAAPTSINQGIYYKTWYSASTPWRRLWDTSNFSQSHINNWNTAFGWGNHASAGYALANGTVNYIPKFTTSGTIGNSLIFDNGTNVGIGTTSPSYKLDVSGDIAMSYGSSIRARNYAYSKLIEAMWNGSYDVVNIYTAGQSGLNSSPKITILNNGKVGIGTTTPSEILDVNGGIISNNKNYFHNQIGGQPIISVAIGDNDTGFNWEGNGSISYYSNNTKKFDLNNVWHLGNDGTGSGLDADLLDGKQGNQFINLEWNSLTQGNNVNYNEIVYPINKNIWYIQPYHGGNYTGQLNAPPVGYYGTILTISGTDTVFYHQLAIGYGGELAIRSSYASDKFTSTWVKYWSTNNFTDSNINNWNAAHSWGSHVDAWNAATLSYSGSTLTLTINGISKTTTINAGSAYTAGTNISISSNQISVVASPTFSGSVTATSFFESSLRKYKTNIKKFDKSGIDLVNSLEIVTFDRIDSDVKSKIGIIADDSPEEFLSEDKCAVDLYKTVFIQAKAIQELKAEIDKLKKITSNARV